MDILTEKGRETLDQVDGAVEIWLNNNPNIRYYSTPEDLPADIDGVLVQGVCVRGIVEVKCRVSMTVQEFCQTYDEMWLITYDKITRAVEVAKALQVPFIGFLYFPKEKTLLVKKIWDPEKGFDVMMEIRKSRTQATVNGGSIVRDNAYIDMREAKRFK
jgi:hypothetical protein